MSVNKKKLTARGKEIYNAGVRSAIKELRQYNGIITDKEELNGLSELIMRKVSCKFPPQKPFKS